MIAYTEALNRGGVGDLLISGYRGPPTPAPLMRPTRLDLDLVFRPELQLGQKVRTTEPRAEIRDIIFVT